MACAVLGVIALGAAALGHPGGIAAARVEAAPSLSIGDRPGKKLLDAEPPPQGLARKSNVGEETWPGAAMAKFIQLRGTARCNVPGAGPWNRATGLVHDCFVEEEPTGDAPTAAAAAAAAVDSSEEDGMLSEERGRATQSENSRYVSKSLRGVSSSLSSPSPERPSPSARTGGVNADGRTQSAAPLPALGKHIGRETASSEAPTEDCWGGEPPLEIAVEDVRGGDASLGFLLGRLKKMVSDLERQPSLLAAPDSGSFVRDQLLLLIQDTAPPIKPVASVQGAGAVSAGGQEARAQTLERDMGAAQPGVHAPNVPEQCVRPDRESREGGRMLAGDCELSAAASLTGGCSTELSTRSLNRQATDIAPSAAPQRVSQTSLWGGSHGAEWLRLLEEGLDETVVQEIILWTMLRIIDDKERLDKLLSCPSSLVQRCLTEPAVWQALCTRHWPALSRDVASWYLVHPQLTPESADAWMYLYDYLVALPAWKCRLVKSGKTLCMLIVHNVAGRRLAADEMPETLMVERRFPIAQLPQFVTLEDASASVLYMQPATPVDQPGYDAFIEYLTTRDRVGLGVDRERRIFYVPPCDYASQNLSYSGRGLLGLVQPPARVSMDFLHHPHEAAPPSYQL